MKRRRNGNLVLFEVPAQQRHDWLMFVVTIALVLMLLLVSHVYRDRHPSPARQDEVADPIKPKVEKVLTPDPCSVPMAVWNESIQTCTEE